MVRSTTSVSASSAGKGPWRRFVDSALSLQCKATVLLVVVTLTVTAGVSGYLLRYSGILARDQHHDQLVQAASMLARAAAVTLSNGDQEGLATLVHDAANGRPLHYAIVTDKLGRELASAMDRRYEVTPQFEPGSGPPASAPGVPSLSGGADEAQVFLEITYPITRRRSAEETGRHGSTELLGYVRTGVTGNPWGRSMSSRFDLLIGIGLIATVVAVPLGFLVVRRIVAPLENLADTISRCAQGRLGVRSTIHRRDEIGRLAEAFNLMADQQQQSHERIVRLNAELEERVTFRTQQLRELASRDPLTGLYNRRYFNEVLERRFSEATRYEGHLSCIMFDLDDFKAANDQFGHHVGDAILVLTSATILSQLRNADVAARYGGDEFIVLLPQTDAEAAQVLTDRIVEKFRQDASERFPKVRVSMSGGVANLHGLEDKDAESLIRAADHALYEAKAAGKKKIAASAALSKSAPA